MESLLVVIVGAPVALAIWLIVRAISASTRTSVNFHGACKIWNGKSSI